MWMPGSGFKHQAAYVKSLVRQVLDRPYAIVQHALVCSTRLLCRCTIERGT